MTKLEINVTDAELAELEYKSDDSGMPLMAYIRDRLGLNPVLRMNWNPCVSEPPVFPVDHAP